MRDTIIIAGHGKLVNSITGRLGYYMDGIQTDTWENHDLYPHHAQVIVHIGSGRQLPAIIDYCKGNKVPLIQGSTGIPAGMTDYDFTYIDAPNFNVLMLKFMYMLKKSGHIFKNYRISITESHQYTKRSTPGTAVEIAGSLGVDVSDIKSVRDQDEQERIYGIPAEFLSLHAFHDIRIQDEGTSINLTTLVKGHELYMAGLSGIIRCADNLENRYYHVLDLVEMNLI